MKRLKRGSAMVVGLLGAALLIPEQTHARLPRAVHLTGTILALDAGSKSLWFKATNGKKPLLLDWDKGTDFSDGAKAIKADKIACPASATIDYKDLTFRHPLLKKVVVANSAQAAAVGH